MSVSGALCKLFRFVLNVFTQVVDVVASAVKVIGGAAVDVLTDLLSSVGNMLGIDGSTLMWIALGVGAYFLFSGSDDDSPSTKQVIQDGIDEGRRALQSGDLNG